MSDFLAKDDKVLDVSSRQIRQVCKSDLEEFASSGLWNERSLAHHVLNMFSRMMYADTQAVEGVNSLIRIISTRCRKITLELLSSRVMLKYCLNYCIAFDNPEKARSKESNSQLQINRGERLLDHIKPFKMAFKLDCSVSRWEPPPVADISVTQQQLVAAQPPLSVGACEVWCASHATAVKKILFPKQRPKTSGEGEVNGGSIPETADPEVQSAEQFPGWIILHFVDRCAGVDSWFVYVNKFHYTLSFHEAVPVHKDGEVRFSFVMPCVPISSTDIFRRFYTHCNEGGSLEVSCVRVPSQFATVGQPATAMENSACAKESGQVLDICAMPESDLSQHTAALFTPTKKLNSMCNKSKTTNKTSRSVANKPSETEDDQGEEADLDEENAVLQAERAVLETNFNEIADSADELEDEGGFAQSSAEAKRDAAAVLQRNLETIQQAVKSGTCPAEAAIHEISKGLCHQPQFSTYSSEDLEEEALLILIRGLRESVDTATSTGADAYADAESPHSMPSQQKGLNSCEAKGKFVPSTMPDSVSADPRISELSCFEEGADTDLPDDKDVSGVFQESDATKSRGPASGFDNPTPTLLRNTARVEIAKQASHAYQEWRKESKVSLEALQSLIDLREEPLSDNISLVLLRPETIGKPLDVGSAASSSHAFELEGSELMYIHWVRSRQSVARQVTLDCEGRVIFSMSFLFPEIHINPRNCAVAVPDASVPMMKVTKRFRPLVPQTIRRIHEIFDRVLRVCVNQDPGAWEFMTSFYGRCFDEWKPADWQASSF